MADLTREDIMAALNAAEARALAAEVAAEGWRQQTERDRAIVTTILTPETLAELRRRMAVAKLLRHGSLQVSLATLEALLDAATERDALAAKVELVREWIDREWRLRNDARLALRAAVAASPTTERTPS